VLVALDAQRFVHRDAAALVERQAELGELGARPDARRPDKGVREDPLAVRELRRTGLGRLQRRVDVDLDAALNQLAGRVLAQPRRDLRKDLRRGVDEHPALRRVPEAWVVADRVAHEVGELRQRLDARVAGADEDEGQLTLPVRLVRGDVGRLQPLQDVVAEVDRVGEVLEAERMVGEPGNRQRPRDRANGDDEVLVADVDEAFERLDLDAAVAEVERRRMPEDELGVRAHRPQRYDDVARLERARRRLREQRGEEHRVLRVDDRRAALAEVVGDVAAGVPAADDHRPAPRFPLGHGSTIAAWPGFRSR
jgi:hypothetical protein